MIGIFVKEHMLYAYRITSHQLYLADLEPFDLFATQSIPAVEQIKVAGR